MTTATVTRENLGKLEGRGRNKMANCRVCGKRTHSSIDGNIGIELCRVCYDESSNENSHSDGAHTPGNGGIPESTCAECVDEGWVAASVTKTAKRQRRQAAHAQTAMVKVDGVNVFRRTARSNWFCKECNAAITPGTVFTGLRVAALVGEKTLKAGEYCVVCAPQSN